ncbi:MAG: thioredoxin family protein [Acidiferrobacterales bacterium]
MKIQLLVSDWSPPCRRAEELWRAVAREVDVELEILNVTEPTGAEIMKRLQLKTISALVIDHQLVAIGVQSKDEARKIAATTHSRR